MIDRRSPPKDAWGGALEGDPPRPIVIRLLSFQGGIGFRGPRGLEWTVCSPGGKVFLVAVDGLPPQCPSREEFNALVHRFHCGCPGWASIGRARRGGQAPRICRRVACVLLDLAPWGPELIEPTYSAEARVFGVAAPRRVSKSNER